MSYPITHITVRDILPPQPETIVIGHMYPIVPETQAAPEPLVIADDEDEDNRAEAKVVKRGRRPGAKTSEVAETK